MGVRWIMIWGITVFHILKITVLAYQTKSNISFYVFSAGWPKQLAAETILRSIKRYFQTVMASSIRQVYFVLYDKESVDIYTSELGKLLDNSD